MDNVFLTNEAFIKRAAMINGDFMLKGSFVTRQYFTNPLLRKPADLDWLYLGENIENVDIARKIFNKWITAVTDYPMGDGIDITSFSENPFWRMIDYAMDDDFPTVNTDLTAKYNDEDVDFYLDLSFNLDPELPAVGLFYHPAVGEDFYLPKTVAPGNQIAWKLHQSIVRLRFKDIFDLYYMLQSPIFTSDILEQALSVYVNECNVDKKDATRINYLINGDWEQLLDVFKHSKLNKSLLLQNTWDNWRCFERKNMDYFEYAKGFDFSSMKNITDFEDAIPYTLDEFKHAFIKTCQQSNLSTLCQSLPAPKTKSRTKFLGLF